MHLHAHRVSGATNEGHDQRTTNRVTGSLNSHHYGYSSLSRVCFFFNSWGLGQTCCFLFFFVLLLILKHTTQQYTITKSGRVPLHRLTLYNKPLPFYYF